MLSQASSQITPKSIASMKSGKLRQDLGARHHEAILQEQELVLQKEAERYKKGLEEVSQTNSNFYQALVLTL